MDRANHSDFYELLRIPNFFDDLALVAESGSIDLHVVNKTLRFPALEQWGLWERAIRKLRVTAPATYTQFEHLARDLRQLDPE